MVIQKREKFWKNWEKHEFLSGEPSFRKREGFRKFKEILVGGTLYISS
jgi:hypothetical protein